MPNVGEVLLKISELKSRQAILLELSSYLRSHFLSSDDGTTELRIQRDDNAAVPESHVQDFLLRLKQELEQIDVEIETWEDLDIRPPDDDGDDGDGDDDDEVAEVVRKGATKKAPPRKKKKNGTASENHAERAADKRGSEGSGQPS